jgi:hypothetical protein
LGDLCDRNNSCAIAEAVGFITPFIVAHEIGHTFGVQHDGVKHDHFAKGCSAEFGYLMSSKIPSGANTFLWSSCSKAKIQQFLRGPKARCLADKPGIIRELGLPGIEPGGIYSARQQCRLTHPDAIHECRRETHWHDMAFLGLPSNWTLCSSLVCEMSNGARCQKVSVSAADFTQCGSFKVCIRGHCVQRMKPRHGGWSPYFPLGKCSRSCGGGVVTLRRYCNNPAPRFYGRNCVGDSYQLKLCNLHDCPGHSSATGHEEEECKTMNGFTGGPECRSKDGKHQRNSHWVPYVNRTPGEECKLHCEMIETGCKVVTTSFRTNGVPCSDDGHYRCVEGVCKKFGCDGVVDSKLVLDECRVCGGHNSTCKRVTKQFNDNLQKESTYLVKKFDTGMFGILIEEMKASKATSLVLKDSDDKHLLDFHNSMLWTEMDYDGTLISYSRVAGQPEVIRIDEPLQKPLQLWVSYFPAFGPNPGIEYSFVRNRTRATDVSVT